MHYWIAKSKKLDTFLCTKFEYPSIFVIELILT